ncbi:MAG TPA: nucleoside recognition protein [Desulfobulbaceae bacterium]|nr:nucleoside recognition protein [Desulfobulbaceae bacterium]
MVTKRTFYRGLKSGLLTTWELALIMVPIYLIMTILSHTPVLKWIGRLCKPLMELMGLPGEAAMGVVLGNLLNLYAAIGAVTPLSLDGSQVTVFALLLLLSHSLVVETAVCKKTGITAWPFVFFRLGMGFMLAIGLYHCLAYF